jgi:hypothetical protein
MIRNLSIGLFFVALLMIFLVINMRSEKAKISALQPFERTYNAEPFRVVSGRRIPCDRQLTDIRLIGGRIFGNQFGKQLVVSLDENGKEIGSWGKNGEGSLFAFVVAWQKDENGLTVIDGKLNKIFRMDNQGSLVSEVPLPYKAIRAAWLKGNSFIIKSPDPRDEDRECFYKLDTETLVSESLEYPLPEYPHSDFTLDGYFSINEKYNFHLCYKTGYFFAFDNDAKFLYGKNTIDNTAPPLVLVSSDGAKRFHPLAEDVNRSAYADDSLLYILSDRKAINDQRKRNIIDCYQLVDGTYTQSFTIPDDNGQAIVDITRSEKGFLAQYSDHITEYVYEKNKPNK